MYTHEEAFKQLLPDAEWEPSGGSNFKTNCPFHAHNESKTLAIDFEQGLWHCFVPDCDVKGKGVEQFKETYKRTLKKDAFYLNWTKGKELLKDDKEAIEYLQHERGLTLEDAELFKIAVSNEEKKEYLSGVVSQKKYLLMPVFDEKGTLIAGRKYLLPKYREKKDPKIMFAWKQSPISLYPDLPEKSSVILTEGEWDALLLRSKGFEALTTTGGQGGAPFTRFVSELKNKKVFICFDCDKAGREGAQQVADVLAKETKVFIVDLGLEDKEDITDFFVKHQKTAEDFKDVLRSAQPYMIPEEEALDLMEMGVDRLNQRQTVKGRIVGEAGLMKYLYPSQGTIKCAGHDLDICKTCPLRSNSRFVSIAPSHADVLELIEEPQVKQKQVFARKASVPFKGTKRCVRWEFDSDLKYEMSVPVFIESTNSTTPQMKKEWHGHVTTESAGNKIKGGREAIFKMTPLQDLKEDGHFTFIADEVIPLQDDLDIFQVTEELHERLKVFQGKPDEKIPYISKQLNDHVFRFRGREELVTAYDLVYHSVIRFNNPNAPNRTVKGWIEALIIGDPGEGKSQLATDMTEYYGLGAYQDAATATPGGLTVTTVQMAGKWIFRDGLMPLNDKRLVFIDEFNRMSGDDLGRLNTSRSSGKITASSSAGTFEKAARTRLVWITNPKSGERIDTNAESVKYPIELVPELFSDRGSQDRLDYAVVVLRDDPKPEFDGFPVQDDSFEFTEELSRSLILWAWTRTPDQIYFTDEAIREIRRQSTKLRERFWHSDSEIELINAGERTTERLMRLSAAVAARVYSTADGVNLFITPDHVQYAVQFLVKQYEKMGFDKYIHMLKARRAYQETEQPEPEVSDQSNPSSANISLESVINALREDRLLYDRLDKGSFDMHTEKERENRTIVKWLFKYKFASSNSNFRYFQFTRSFYDDLLPQMQRKA